MKLLIVTGIFPPDCGGPASYVPRMAAALSGRGHDVDVVTLTDNLDHDDSTSSFRVHRIRRRLFWPIRLLVTIWTVWRLARHKDIVYVNGLSTEATLGARLARRRTVHKIVGDYAWERARARRWFAGTIDDYQTARKGLRLRLLDFIRTRPLRHASRIIVPSDYLRRIVAGWRIKPERIQVVYNAVQVDAAAAPALPAINGKVNDSAITTLITVCRLVPWKGVDALIRIVGARPNLRLVIAGEGVLRAELEQLANTCGAGERVRFLGRVPQDQVHTHLQHADMFVLNSTYEGLPHIVLEAMSAGTPVIATNAGGTGEVVENEVTGLLVPPGDEPSLAGAIERLAADRELARRLVAQARKQLDGRFAFETMVHETETTLLECAGLSRGLSVLSLGFTRGLWEGETAEDYQRMLGYAQHLDRYVVVTNSYRKHKLTPRSFGTNVQAIPTNALSPLDSLVRMFCIGVRSLRERKASLVQAQDPCYSGLPAVLLGKLFRLPVVVCVYGPNVYDQHWRQSHWSHGVMAPLGRWVLRQARCIQVDGRLTEKSLLAAGHRQEQIVVKPLVPCNIEKFLAIERDPAAPTRVPRLLFAGRLAHQKNLPLLLRVAKRLRDDGQRFELLMIGAGPEEKAVRTMIERDNLGDVVRLGGVVSREDVAQVFADADIFVLSSHYEGYPRVLMEAAAASMPIVTTAVSGSDDAVIDGSNGFIVPIGELEPLVEKLTLLINDPDLRARMGEAGRRHIVEQMDPAANAPRQLAIWRKVTP